MSSPAEVGEFWECAASSTRWAQHAARAIEDLFVLAADVGIPHVDIVLAPSRVGPVLVPAGGQTVWDLELNHRIDAALAELR